MNNTNLTDDQQKLRTKWVEALESGEFKQTKRNLCKRNLNQKRSYCCLGLLCEIAKPGSLKPLRDRYDALGNPLMGSSILAYNNELYFPPDEILDLVGINKTQAANLAHVNDTGSSFKAIAKLIRKF